MACFKPVLSEGLPAISIAYMRVRNKVTANAVQETDSRIVGSRLNNLVSAHGCLWC